MLRRSSTEQRNLPESEASRLCGLHGHRTSHCMTETGTPSTEQARHGLPRVATLLRRSSTEQRNFPESEASRLCDLHGHRTSHCMTETEQAPSKLDGAKKLHKKNNKAHFTATQSSPRRKTCQSPPTLLQGVVDAFNVKDVAKGRFVPLLVSHDFKVFGRRKEQLETGGIECLDPPCFQAGLVFVTLLQCWPKTANPCSQCMCPFLCVCVLLQQSG